MNTPHYRLILVFVTIFLSQAIGSVFNFTFNLVHLEPELSPDQAISFIKSCGWFNALVYPPLIFCWGWIVFSLERARIPLEIRQQRAICLPIWATIISGAGWLFSIPVLMFSLTGSPQPIDSKVFFHLPVSILVSGFTSVALSYLAVEWMCQKYVFPELFKESSPASFSKGRNLTVGARAILWTVAASVCPILALVLLQLQPTRPYSVAFGVSVGGISIAIAFALAYLLNRLVAIPVNELMRAARRVGQGDIDVQLPNHRADEFGILTDEFNTMVEGLREKERITNTLGRHVGREVAHELLANESDLDGIEKEIAVLFSDIRGFTTRCEQISPKNAVRILNVFHSAMTEEIETNHGIMNQIIGDGLMAIFGATSTSARIADNAVDAAIAIMGRMPEVNQHIEEMGFDAIRIGIGIHTGPAVIGVIGSPLRQIYTAIGDTVNTAARIEGKTKELKTRVLISESTWNQLKHKPKGRKLPAQHIRGRKHEITLYRLDI
jgi:adenylate cyclase